MPGAGHLAPTASPVEGGAAARATEAVPERGVPPAPGECRVAEGAGQEDAGSGFFEGCLRKGRGSASEQYRLWRNGIWEVIRELMPTQGSLGIEPMCRLAQVSRRRILPFPPATSP